MVSFCIWNGDSLLGRYVAHLLALAYSSPSTLEKAQLVVLVEPEKIPREELTFIEERRSRRSKLISIGEKPLREDIPHLSPPFKAATFFSFIEETLDRLFPLNLLERERPFLGEDEKIERLRATLPTLAELPEPVLLEGEPGTGKELFARHLHARVGGVFEKFATGALPKEMIEPLLFGFGPGVMRRVKKPKEGFLWRARDGVLYLENLENLPLSAQQKLLFFLETGTFFPVGSREPVSAKPKLVVSLTRSPGLLIQEGKLLDALYFRLARFSFHLPPLRKRLIDLPLLTEHFLEHYAALYRRPMLRLDEDFFRDLLFYRWPRNVAELEETVKDLVIFGVEKVRSRFAKEKLRVRVKLQDVEEILARAFRLKTSPRTEPSRKDQAGRRIGSP